MSLVERCASLYGPRPVQVFDPDLDSAAARERRAIVRQATNKADSLLQIQAIFLCGFCFALLIVPFPIAVGTYLLIQLTELHALIVFRAVYKAAQDPKASLGHLKRPIWQLSYSLAIVGSLCVSLVYVTSPESWSLGVLAGCGIGAAYFIPFARQNGSILYTTLGIFHATLLFSALARPYYLGNFSFEMIAAPLALVLFMMVTTIAIAVNVRIEHFKRLGDEELIEHAFSELKAESRAKSALLARIGHEIRTPLNGVLGTAALLESKVVQDDQKALVKVMRDSGDNLLELLNRLLDVSAAEIDAISIQPSLNVLDPLVRDEVALFSGQAAAEVLELTLEGDFCKTPRMMDEVRIRQCLANLIVNAINHSGGDRIAIKCISASDDVITVSVSDNGCGIAEDRRADIFRIFGAGGLRGDHTGRGVGLGLALTRSIARAMGGELTVSGCSGPGATFVLRFVAPKV